MKILKVFYSAIFVVMMLAGSAAAQDKSLADLPAGEKYTSTDANFSISLFKEPTSVVKTEPTVERNERAIQFTWKLKEGLVIIEFNEFLNGASFKSDKQYEAFFTAFKNSIVGQEGVKIISENPLTLGDYKGINFLLDASGAKSLTRMIAGGNRYYTITAVSYVKTAGYDAPFFKAIETFSITPVTK